MINKLMFDVSPLLRCPEGHLGMRSGEALRAEGVRTCRYPLYDGNACQGANMIWWNHASARITTD